MNSAIKFKVGDIIHKMVNGKIDMSTKYKIKELDIVDECNWHSGYEVTVNAKIVKLGISINEQQLEDYIVQYICHVYQMDNIYAVIASESPSVSLDRHKSVGWKSL